MRSTPIVLLSVSAGLACVACIHAWTSPNPADALLETQWLGLTVDRLGNSLVIARHPRRLPRKPMETTRNEDGSTTESWWIANVKYETTDRSASGGTAEQTLIHHGEGNWVSFQLIQELRRGRFLARRTSEGVMIVAVPVWFLPLLLGSYPALLLVTRTRRRIHRRRYGLCIKCGYNLAGNTTGICPECGMKR